MNRCREKGFAFANLLAEGYLISFADQGFGWAPEVLQKGNKDLLWRRQGGEGFLSGQLLELGRMNSMGKSFCSHKPQGSGEKLN